MPSLSSLLVRSMISPRAIFAASGESGVGGQIVPVHEAAECAFVFPAIDARTGVENGFGQGVLGRGDGGAAVNYCCGPQTCAV